MSDQDYENTIAMMDDAMDNALLRAATHMRLAEARATQIKVLEERVAELRELVERTCGDGCHCMDENNKDCALAALDKGEV